MKKRKLLNVLLLSFISFILVACGIVTKQSMIDNLQNNSWTITRNNSASATNIKFLKDGTVSIDGESYSYEVSEDDSTFSLSQDGYILKFKISSSSDDSYNLKLTSAKVTDPTLTIQREPDLKSNYKTLKLSKE